MFIKYETKKLRERFNDSKGGEVMVGNGASGDSAWNFVAAWVVVVGVKKERGGQYRLGLAGLEVLGEEPRGCGHKSQILGAN